MRASEEILKDIQISSETGCVVKLKLKDILNPVITAVEQVTDEAILLKPTCLYGYPLDKRNITLPEIEYIKRYKTYFHHPLFERIRFVKNNISAVRKNLEMLGRHPAKTLTTKAT